MNWFRDHWFKVAILSCVVLAITIASIFVNKHLQQSNALEQQSISQQKQEKDRAYFASQKKACLAIYKQESAKWNNVDGWRYDQENDQCIIRYKESNPKSKVQCNTEYMDASGTVPLELLGEYFLCEQGVSEEAF